MRILIKRFEITIHDEDVKCCSKDCMFCTLETEVVGSYECQETKVFYKCKLYDNTWDNIDGRLERADECTRDHGYGKDEV